MSSCVSCRFEPHSSALELPPEHGHVVSAWILVLPNPIVCHPQARAAEIAADMPHRHLSMALWSVATLSRGCPDDAMLTALADAFVENIEQAPPQVRLGGV